MYKVFIRNWWQYDRNGNIVPDSSARKYTLDYVSSEEQARKLCAEYNTTHKPGKLSRKAEYTSNY